MNCGERLKRRNFQDVRESSPTGYSPCRSVLEFFGGHQNGPTEEETLLINDPIISREVCPRSRAAKFQVLQTRASQFQLSRLSLSPAQERKYKKLKNEIIGEVKSLRLNRARIEALIDQLYDINKRLVGYEGRLLRLAESNGVGREDFLKNYLGSELDPLWLNRVSNLSAHGWKNFIARDKNGIKELRAQIHALASETGLEIGEFRKIVHAVQKGEREALQAKKEMVEANLNRKSV